LPSNRFQGQKPDQDFAAIFLVFFTISAGFGIVTVNTPLFNLA
jgi:hypothetical protein